MASAQELYRIADELREIASGGLLFAENHYDKDRYGHILALCARLIASVEHQPADEILARLQDNLWHLSPLAAVETVVFQNDKLLLIQRSDDKLWALPGGLVEIGETLASAAQRETWEETGFHVRLTKLLGIFDSLLWQTESKVQLYHSIFLAEIASGQATPSQETLQVDFFDEYHLPPLSQGHHVRIPFIFQILRGEIPTPFFDPVIMEK